MRGNSALFSGLDSMRIGGAGSPAPDAGTSADPGVAAIDAEAAVVPDQDVCMPAEEEEGLAETMAAAPSGLPQPMDVGRRLEVFWVDEGSWFGGVLAQVEAGHDDGGDAGDYLVLYDDGDEQWEPLGSRTPYRWASERPHASQTHSSGRRALDKTPAKSGAKSGTKSKGARKAVRKPRPPAGDRGAAVPSSVPPTSLDIGRRLEVFWLEEATWFGGVLAAIEAGHDDGRDTGDFQVIYDDGDEQWEALGSRTPFRWVNEPSSLPGSVTSPGGASESSGSSPGPPPPPARFKRMLSEKSTFAAMPEAKHAETDNMLELS